MTVPELMLGFKVPPLKLNVAVPGSLAPGTYVLFATTSKNQVTASACEWGSLPDLAAYSAGSHVFMNNGADPSQWTTVAWGTEPFDLAFEVNMTPAPPPQIGRASSSERDELW